MFFVAHGSFVSVSFAVFGIETCGCFIRRRVVLNDQVIPIANPHGTIGAGFSKHWTRPSIGRVVEVVRQLLGNKTRAFRCDLELAHQLACAFGHESNRVVVFFGETTSCVNSMAGTSSVALELVHLTNVSGGRIEDRIVIATRSLRLGDTGFVVERLRQ